MMYNRGTFCCVLEALVAEFENDHEEHTGVSDTDRMTFHQWVQELMNLYENTR